MTDNKTSEHNKTSVSPVDEEPKPTGAESVGAKPATGKIAHDAVVGTGDTDAVYYSKAKVPGRTEPRKSLTVLHVQRRLTDKGFHEAQSAPGGRFENLTTAAVRKYQDSRGDEITGVLTRQQFEDLFENDPNVTVTLDTTEDHQV